MRTTRRVKRLINANVTRLLDWIEEPSLTARQGVVEMDDLVRGARRQLAACRIAERRLAAQIGELERAVTSWGERARQAAARGDDRRARQALRARRQSAVQLRRNEELHARLRDLSSRVTEAVANLEERLREARLTETVLRARHTHARARRSLEELVIEAAEIVPAEAEAPGEGISEAESRITALEAEAEGLTTAALGAGGPAEDDELAIEAELADLKGPGSESTAGPEPTDQK